MGTPLAYCQTRRAVGRSSPNCFRRGWKTTASTRLKHLAHLRREPNFSRSGNHPYLESRTYEKSGC